ncbi:MAG TPA: murein biosynthesis integral membrane protein MurJ [Pedomonas sp.]|uniref:murein biosynthesis integral membrane protein MurJ n=1 Tax=Pedomonas sp. TaxID=2976421 RepID=UPI002F41B575
MTLIRAASLIGGLTLVSRILGFAREMIMARVLGAGLAADAFNLAFKLPNVFRRLFAEGAFASAFVPLFSREKAESGLEAARRFAEDVLAVLLPALLLLTALAEMFMPAAVWLLNGGGGFADVPGKLETAVSLSRVTFPYLLFISLAALLGGILNSLSRFAASASAPVLLNIVLIAALLLASGDEAAGEVMTARWLAWGVAAAGLLQFLWLLWACRRAGVRLTLRRPRLSPRVKRFFAMVGPAALGAGVYQISQLIDLFFASRLPQGSLSYLNYADRLNQLPLGVVGIALGTALLPALAAHIAKGEQAQAIHIQNRAAEMALFLSLPAAAALMVLSHPLVTALYMGGRFSAADAAATAAVLTGLAAGLPAYVLVKVLTPAFFARGDTATPVKTALAALGLNVALILLLIGPYGVAGLAWATAASAWANCALLYWMLHRAGSFRFDAVFRRRMLGTAAASGLMAASLAALLASSPQDFAPLSFDGGTLERVGAVLMVVFVGALVYFTAAALLGVMPLRELKARLRRGGN